MTTLVLLAYTEILTAPCWNNGTFLIDRTVGWFCVQCLDEISYNSGLYIDIGHASSLLAIYRAFLY